MYFIGTIRTPWRVREECPKRGEPDGPVCSIVVDERWREALTDIAGYKRVQVLYWMHHARRDLVLQTPFRTGQTTDLRAPLAGAAKSCRFVGGRTAGGRGNHVARAGA